ncbi:MAG TPA: zinc-binding dehydrogenase [Acidimicrobiales bacterium]|nr:zinc-binding dehydrogenase [Acidimicrobiales bacterium]
MPGPGELLLRTLSTAICASDVHFMDHPEMAIDDPTGRSLYDANCDIVMGHEFVGEVIGHGPGCGDQFPIGTRVTSMPVRFAGANGEVDFNAVRIIGQHPEAQGSFGELVVVPEMMAKAAPGDASSDAVAVVDAFAVGEFYVRSSNIQPGEVAIVVGAGAIGLSAVAALASRGVEPIVVMDFNPERRALAQRFGAHIVADPAERSLYEVWEQALVDHGLLRAPVIYECVGAHGLVQQLVEGAPMGTRLYVAGGWYSGDQLDITTASRQGVTIQFGGGPQPEDWYGTLDAVVEGRLDPTPTIGEVIGLDGVPDALERARRSEGPPRIVVRPNG